MKEKRFVLIGNIEHIRKVLALLKREFGDIKVSELLEMEGKND